MKPVSGIEAPRRFPYGGGSSAVWQLNAGRKLTLFVVDASMPLYNLVIGDIRFFANAEQVMAFVERLEAAPDERPSRPKWIWVLETGFDKSVDGSPNKGWRLREE
ncbi:hypothetical protein AWB76_07317 [Caballeronia temeraria]|uniref:Uncharacterized protein n=1 Tax=Caballeronia temeraria TaxID=1777137 RepID=A0A158DPZ6_9BURK|nr:hypothetical protein [Caballeronia temeraria]SAK96563.1 hypothetical protein AWB76_07317 [Caballeronia temeraria]